MQRLSALGKPYKYVVTCIIMQKTGGAGSWHSLRVWGQARQWEVHQCCEQAEMAC